MDTQEQQNSQPPVPAVRPIEEVESVVIRFCGDSGDGMQLTGGEFTKASALAGNDISTLPDFPAEIRAPAGSLAGVSGYQLQFSSREVFTPGDQPNTLVAMNPAALKTNLPDLLKGGSLIINTAAFGKSNLAKAGYAANPLEDGSLDGYRVYKVDITGLTKECLKDSGLNTKSMERCKNFFALGMTFWMYNRPTEPEIRSIQKKFGKKQELADANIRVFKAGYHYGETAEIFNESFQVRPADSIDPGRYRNIMGNSATAVGLVTGCQLAELPLTFAGYPITPASSILHELSHYRAWGVTTLQMEDEIAAAGAAVGASFGGALGVTASSGPGIALKGETLGLANILELPMVIVNVQRGGPSTGLPTKTEQADLLQAMYGRNGESAACPSSPPVTPGRLLLRCHRSGAHRGQIHGPRCCCCTDGYLANGSEPWRLPAADAFEAVPGAVPHRREASITCTSATRPRSHASGSSPGTPGLAHRVGGLEKDALTGNVSVRPREPRVHVQDLRQSKAMRVARRHGRVAAQRRRTRATCCLLGWGSTYGAITRGHAARCRQQGLQRPTSVHLRWLHPFNPRLGELLKRFKKVLVPEMNLGQLASRSCAPSTWSTPSPSPRSRASPSRSLRSAPPSGPPVPPAPR